MRPGDTTYNHSTIHTLAQSTYSPEEEEVLSSLVLPVSTAPFSQDKSSQKNVDTEPFTDCEYCCKEEASMSNIEVLNNVKSEDSLSCYNDTDIIELSDNSFEQVVVMEKFKSSFISSKTMQITEKSDQLHNNGIQNTEGLQRQKYGQRMEILLSQTSSIFHNMHCIVAA